MQGGYRSGALTALLIIGTLAGCVAPGGSLEEAASTPPESETALSEPVDLGLDMVAESCTSAGGVAQNVIPPILVSPEDIGVPHPFVPADVAEYLGAPVDDADRWLIGNAHTAIVCESWTVNGEHAHHAGLGWVGLVVEAPPFEGVEPAAHNYLVSMVGTQEPALTGALTGAGWYVYPAQSHVRGWSVGERWQASGVIQTAGDGLYESHLTMDAQPESWDLVRLWLILEGPDGKLHPAHLDMRHDGGTTYLGPGLFSHTLTGDHPGGRGDAASGGMGFRDYGFTASLTLLPHVMEEAWSH